MRSATDPGARRRVVGRAGPAAALLFAAASWGACSFVLDFPEQPAASGGGGASSEGGGGAGGEAGAGGAGGAGGGFPACFGGGTGPVANELTWQGIPKRVGFDQTVATTGLTFVASQDELIMYGNTSDGLQGFDMAEGESNQIYAVGRHGNGNLELVISGLACTWPWQNHHASTRRIAADATFFLLYAAGSLATDGTGAATWSIAGSDTNTCGTSAQTVVATASDVPAGDVPLAIKPRFDGIAVPMMLADGVVLDIDAADDGAVGFMGAAQGIVDGETVTDTSVFVSVSDQPDFNQNVVVVGDLFIDTSLPKRTWPGALAFDDGGTVWFGGSACDAAGGCADPSLFLGRMAFEDAAPTLLESHGVGASAVTSIRFQDRTFLVGGHYQGALSFRGSTLPDADTTVPFVAAVAPDSEQALWTWPAADAPSGADPDRWLSVVDIAVSGSSDCGAVYVLGCSSPISVGYRDCLTIEPGKTSFLTKLDFETGVEIWTRTIELATVFDLFMPTAIASADERVWVAATFSGAVDAWGQELRSGMSRESVVLSIAP